MITDQRAHNRVSFFFGGDIYKDADGEKVGRVIIRDISFSGLRIETLEPWEPGQTVFLDFDIAGRFEFRRVPVVVARSDGNQGSFVTGLNFRQGEDRRRVRHALTYAIESSN
ncbi:MAG: PilZ domain-containing protein [Elusimicrobia bacterium]|nr:PilZ domain-containing protein [Elusimicrobiota bacterium]